MRRLPDARPRVELHERLADGRVVRVPLGLGALDVLQDFPDRVDELEQPGRHLGVHDQLPVAETAQQVFPDMGDGFELPEAEATAGPLDGVDGAEDAGELLGAGRVGFERDEVAIEAVEVLIASRRGTL